MTKVISRKQLSEEETNSGRFHLSFSDVLHPSYRTVVIGFLGLVALLTVLNPRFITPNNLTNLMLQVVPVAAMAFGAVIVLLMGDIDLSLGSVSGLSAALTGVLTAQAGISAQYSILIALASAFFIGILHGFVVTRFAIPAFIVTLGGLLTWQGVQLIVLGRQGNVNIADDLILSLTSSYLPTVASYVLVVVSLLFPVINILRRRNRRITHGLSVPPLAIEILKKTPVFISVIAVAVVLLTARGIPVVLVFMMALALLMHVTL